MELTYLAVILKVDWRSSGHYSAKLFIRHFLSSSVNGDAYLFASNVIAEFFGVIIGHYDIFNLRTRNRLQWKSIYIEGNSKWNWHVIKKMCVKFPFVHIIDLFCWCCFRGNYTYFVLYKIVIFSVHIFIKI